jgi:hypothetical protein
MSGRSKTCLAPLLLVETPTRRNFDSHWRLAKQGSQEPNRQPYGSFQGIQPSPLGNPALWLLQGMKWLERVLLLRESLVTVSHG